MFASPHKFRSSETQWLYELADAYATATGQSIRTVGRKAASQGLFFERMADNKDVTSDRRRRIVQWFADRWPDGTAWPKGFERPQKTPSLEGAA